MRLRRYLPAVYHWLWRPTLQLPSVHYHLRLSMQLRMLLPAVYFWLWAPLLLVPVPFAFYTLCIVFSVSRGSLSVCMFISALLSILSKVFQAILKVAFAAYYTPEYKILCTTSTTLSVATLVLYISASEFHEHFVPIGISAILNLVQCAFEQWFVRTDMRELMLSRSLVKCLDRIVAGDSIRESSELRPRRASPRTQAFCCLGFLLAPVFRRFSTKPISLRSQRGSEQELELGLLANDCNLDSWSVPPSLASGLRRWLWLRSSKKDWREWKALWITTDSEVVRSSILPACVQLLSSSETGKDMEIVDVDVSSTHTVHWPFVRGLALACPEYSLELGVSWPTIMNEFTPIYHPWIIGSLFQWGETKPSSWDIYGIAQKIVPLVITRHIDALYEMRSDNEPALRCVTLIIHGLRNCDQVKQLYDTLKLLRLELRERYRSICVVVVSESHHFSTMAKKEREILRSLNVMHVPENGAAFYFSSRRQHAPALNEKLFTLLCRGMVPLTCSEITRLWPMVLQISSDGQDAAHKALEGDFSTQGICIRIHVAWQIRKRILELLTMTSSITRSEIPHLLRQDNDQVASILQALFLHEHYRSELGEVPEEQVISMLNMIHAILGYGPSGQNMSEDYKLFTQHAHRLLSSLSTRLGILPEELAITGIELAGEHPVKHGGFANIYRGRYTDIEGKDVQVALKVLKVFGDQSHERRVKMLQKFSKEALVWRFLKHKNVLEFLGVDSTTFPGSLTVPVVGYVSARHSQMILLILTLPFDPPCLTRHSPVGSQFRRSGAIHLLRTPCSTEKSQNEA